MEGSATHQLTREYMKIYNRLSEEIKKLVIELDAKGTLSKAEIYKMASYQQLMADINQELNKFGATAAAGFTKDARMVLEQASQDTAAFLKALGYGKPTQLNPRFVESIVGFLEPGGALLERIEKWGSLYSGKISNALIEGVAMGYSPFKTADLITNILGGNLTDALRMSRTVTNYAYREGTRANYLANSDVITGWVWFAELDDLVCLSCVEQHGKIFPLDETLNDHYNGRCAMLPWNPAMDDLLPEKGEDWFLRQDEDTQRRMMGDERFDAWKDNKFAFQDLSKTRYDEVFGNMRFEASLKDLLALNAAPPPPPLPPKPAPKVTTKRAPKTPKLPKGGAGNQYAPDPSIGGQYNPGQRLGYPGYGGGHPGTIKQTLPRGDRMNLQPFTPAKTMDEALARLKGYINDEGQFEYWTTRTRSKVMPGGLKVKGLSLETLNQTLRALDELSGYGLDYGYIGFAPGEKNYLAAYWRPFRGKEWNRALFYNKERVLAFEKRTDDYWANIRAWFQKNRNDSVNNPKFQQPAFRDWLLLRTASTRTYTFEMADNTADAMYLVMKHENYHALMQQSGFMNNFMDLVAKHGINRLDEVVISDYAAAFGFESNFRTFEDRMEEFFAELMTYVDYRGAETLEPKMRAFYDEMVTTLHKKRGELP